MVKRIALLVGIVVLVAAGVALVAASQTEAQGGNGLAVEAVGNAINARSGNTERISVTIAVNSTNGPVGGLNVSNIQFSTVLVAPGGCTVAPQGLEEIGGTPGVYRVDLMPSVCNWLTGNYTLAYSVFWGTMSGSGVVNVSVP